MFIIVAGAMLLAVNTHLMAAARLTGRGEGATLQQMPLPARLLASQLLVPVLKFLLFFVSFVFSNALFFATQFGPHSCFFSTYGFQGYPVPWWVSHPSLLLTRHSMYAIRCSCTQLPLNGRVHSLPCSPQTSQFWPGLGHADVCLWLSRV